ncbi:MAG: hypothetical protein P1V97_21030 [Planctomycetota bacterium]|nr:hypothetical protein [Planctomycetota bacterium]
MERESYLQLMVVAATKDALVWERLLFHPEEFAGNLAVYSRYVITESGGYVEAKKALESDNKEACRRALLALLATTKPSLSLKPVVVKLRQNTTDTEIRILCEDLLFLFSGKY